MWELTAAIIAGFGAAGIALLLRSLTAQRFPRWTIPALAGVGMLITQIAIDYSWFSHQRSLLPERVRPVKVIEDSSLWRPWTLMFPLTVRFIALELGEGAANATYPHLVLAKIYFFQRGRATTAVHQVFDCRNHSRAHFGPFLRFPTDRRALSEQWIQLQADDALLVAACSEMR